MGLGKTIEMMSLIHTRNKAVAADEATSTPLGLNSLRRVSIAPTEVEFAANTTLVVAPMSLLAQWQSEAERASQAGSLKVCVYYGSDKSVDLRSLCSRYTSAGQLMLVITSYGTVLSEYSQVAESGKARAAHGGLFSIEYNRVILDEAHLIKNRQSKTAKACYELHALHRWVLTGTPIVNRLEDLFSLVHFLRVEPWSNFSFWKTFITAPFESKNFLRALNVVQTVLEPLLLRRTKDMKSPSGERLITLPPRTIEIRQIELSGPEREVYDHILTRAKRTFNANVEAGTLMKSYTTIFAQILRLRQSCCHPFLVRGSGGGSSGAAGADGDEAATASADAASGLADDVDLQSLIDQFTDGEGQDPGRMQHRFEAHVLRQIQQEADNECPICSDEPMKEQTVTSCWHSACKACLLSYIDRQQKQSEVVRCFTCREALSLPDTFEVVRETGRFGAVRNTVSDDSTNNDGDGNDSTNGTNNNGNGNGAQPSIPSPDGAHNISLRRLGQESSAKIAALLDSLRALRQQDPALKSVVFSQFTSFLDLIAAKLDKNGIGHLRLDGTLSQKQRAAVLVAYAAPGAAAAARGTVLLISLRAGGVGLNLTTARRVFLMDPWWSFAVEAQAIDRVHRMGQEHQVTVHRFIVADSIEEKMLKIQDRKKFMYVFSWFASLRCSVLYSALYSTLLCTLHCFALLCF